VDLVKRGGTGKLIEGEPWLIVNGIWHVQLALAGMMNGTFDPDRKQVFLTAPHGTESLTC